MKYLVLAVKLAISVALIWVVVTHVNFAASGDFLKSRGALFALAVCIVILIAQAWLAAVRLRWIMLLMDEDAALGLNFSTWMIGLFISQTLVTFIAGDAARIWQYVRHGYGRRQAGSFIFLERALGFAVLMTLVLICEPFLLAHGAAGAVRVGLLIVAALCGGGIGAFVASAFFHHAVARLAPRLHATRIASALIDVTSAARHLGRSWKLTSGVVLLSVVMHLCNAVAFYVLGLAAGAHLDLAITTVVALPVMLIALMPIALAGWGVREGAAIVGFGLFGVAPATALSISVAFGLALLVASLPGGVYLWLSKPAVARIGFDNPG